MKNHRDRLTLSLAISGSESFLRGDSALSTVRDLNAKRGADQAGIRECKLTGHRRSDTSRTLLGWPSQKGALAVHIEGNKVTLKRPRT